MSKIFQILEVSQNIPQKIYEEETYSGYIYTAVLDLFDENELSCFETEFDEELFYVELSAKKFKQAKVLLDSMDDQEIEELAEEWDLEFNGVSYTKQIIDQEISNQVKKDNPLNLIFTID